MHTKIKKICCFTLTVIVFANFSGCGDKPAEQPKTEVVKAFKLEKKQNKDIQKKVDADSQKNQSGTAETTIVAPIPDNRTAGSPDDVVEPGTETTKNIENPETVVEDNPPPAETEHAPAKIPADVTIEEPDLPKSVGEVASDYSIEKDSKLYNPKGRVNPFLPLFRPRVEKIVKSSEKVLTTRDVRIKRGLTPLEKLDLSQLKLTGILCLSSAKRSMAMVEEKGTGKGHVIKIGTYIGVNSGRIVEINKYIVTIEEEVENYMGDIVVRKRELKLQKPLGER